MARYWAIGPSTTNEEAEGIIKQMKELGATQAQIEEYKKGLATPDLLIMEENKNAVFWFCDVDDQFIRDNGFLVGLDIKAIQADAELSGRDTTPKDYQKLRYLGRKASVFFNESRSKKWH